MKVSKLTKISPSTAHQIRELLIQLSRTGKDKGEIPDAWFQEVISSPYHDLLIAKDDSGKIIGIACMSVVMGPGIGKNAYLEDFVTDSSVRGQGVGSALWKAMLDWAKAKNCQNLEFTCGQGREAAQKFYLQHGASIYDTNFFRKSL